MRAHDKGECIVGIWRNDQQKQEMEETRQDFSIYLS